MQQRHLGRLAPHRRARPLAVKGVGNHRKLVFVQLGDDRDKVIARASIAAGQRPAQPTRTTLDQWRYLKVHWPRNAQGLNRAPSIRSTIQIKLDQVQVADGWPGFLPEPGIRVAHPLGDQRG
ncbi:hypothetical protein D3C81_587330 [compost metagenome]